MSQPLALEQKLSPTHQLLLNSVLGHADVSLNAWEEWKSQIDLDLLDDGSFRLLPSLYQRLRTHGVSDPLVLRLRNVYQHSWYKNNMLINALNPLWTTLQSAHIACCAVDDLAVMLTAYADPGLRPLSGNDIFIPPPDLHLARQLLPGLDWSLVAETRPPARISHYLHSTGCTLRVHHLLELRSPSRLQWTGPLAAEIQPSMPPALSAPWLVIQACLQLAPWVLHPVPAAVLDVFYLVAGWQQDDWSTLIDLAGNCLCILPVLDVITLLHKRFHASIPAEVLKCLAEQISSQERAFYQFSLRYPRLANVWIKWLAYNRLSGNAYRSQKCLGFPAYLLHSHHRSPRSR